MRTRILALAGVGAALAVALQLFALGLTVPLGLRLAGDARLYLAIAGRFNSWAAALAYAGDRSLGMPLFDFASAGY